MKRNDLQGVRGVAIIAVLAFHFYPQHFPNGFIGVDVFFVLSGFLMKMIFGSKPLTNQSIIDFYYRRSKRILPLYLLIIFLGIISVFFIFPPTFLSINIDSAWNSIFFYHNMATHSNNNLYFKMLNQADDIFTHTWSLCVEMQFYLLAPFIFWLLAHCRTASQILILHSLMIAFSLTVSQLVDSDAAFNSVFCRIWQFLMGSLAFFVGTKLVELDKTPRLVVDKKSPQFQPLIEAARDEEMEEAEGKVEEGEEDVNKMSVKPRQNFARLPFQVLLWSSLAMLIFVSTRSVALQPTLLRVASTLSTTLLIVSGCFAEPNPLKLRFLVYIGDVSYSLYLVHWPIFVYVKFYYSDDGFVKILALSFSILISIVISETYEKYYRKLNKPTISLLISGFYIIILTIVLNSEYLQCRIDHWKHEAENQIASEVNTFDNVTLEQAIALNKKWARDEYKNLIIPNCFPNKTEHGFCEFENSSLKGELNVFIVGNSYTPNLAGLVYKSFGRHAKTMAKYSESFCEVLTLLNTKKGRCDQIFKNYQAQVAKRRPDVLFIIDKPTKLVQPLSGNLSAISSDPIFNEALKTLQNYEAIVKKKIFLIDPTTPPRVILLSKFAEALQTNPKSVSQKLFKIDLSYLNGVKRLEELVKRCDKCESIKVSKILFNGTETKSFDEKTKLGYYYNGLHLTPMAQQLIFPVFQQISDNFHEK